jgi:hypothetical protein
MRARKNGDRPHFVRKRTFSNCGENIRKWGLSPFFLHEMWMIWLTEESVRITPVSFLFSIHDLS